MNNQLSSSQQSDGSSGIRIETGSDHSDSSFGSTSSFSSSPLDFKQSGETSPGRVPGPDKHCVVQNGADNVKANGVGVGPLQVYTQPVQQMTQQGVIKGVQVGGQVAQQAGIQVVGQMYQQRDGQVGIIGNGQVGLQAGGQLGIQGGATMGPQAAGQICPLAGGQVCPQAGDQVGPQWNGQVSIQTSGPVGVPNCLPTYQMNQMPPLLDAPRGPPYITAPTRCSPMTQPLLYAPMMPDGPQWCPPQSSPNNAAPWPALNLVHQMGSPNGPFVQPLNACQGQEQYAQQYPSQAQYQCQMNLEEYNGGLNPLVLAQLGYLQVHQIPQTLQVPQAPQTLQLPQAPQTLQLPQGPQGHPVSQATQDVHICQLGQQMEQLHVQVPTQVLPDQG